jgi:hypothetical protein
VGTHLQVQLYDGFATVARLVARLKALGAEISEVHTQADQMCVHLASPADARRVRTVLERCADATVSTGSATSIAPCRGPVSPSVSTPTTYVVWSESVASDESRPRRRPKVNA